MGAADLQLPNIKNGDIEVGIASGIDDIDEPYAVLRICHLPKAHATSMLQVVQATVNIKLSGGTPAQTDLDVIKAKMGIQDDAGATTWAGRRATAIAADIMQKYPHKTAAPDVRATLATNPCPVSGTKENQVWNAVINIVVSKGWYPTRSKYVKILSMSRYSFFRNGPASGDDEAVDQTAVTNEPVEEENEAHYPRRVRKPPARYGFGGVTAEQRCDKGQVWDNPTYQEAKRRVDWPLWREAIIQELNSIKAKGVFEKLQADAPRKPLPTKLVLDIKRDTKGNIIKYKARLVVKGFRQVQGRDYEEVYAPTVNMTTVRAVLADAVELCLYIGQFDVEVAFLNGNLTEEIYVRLPDELGGDIWRLKKALYGLKQAARVWHQKLREIMESLGYESSCIDPCLFTRG
jgi:hypothetical protein